MIFLSYVSEDRSRVLPFYEFLEDKGLDPWMDSKKLLGGQNWDYEIRTALDRANLIIVFVSDNSVDKAGYAQREIAIAIDKYEERVFGATYIIPVQLDDGYFPHLLKGIQFIKAKELNINDQLLSAIEHAQSKQSDVIIQKQQEAEVRWSHAEAKSSYSGIPGYATNIHKLQLTSRKYQNLSEISDHVNGSLTELAMISREVSLLPDSKLYNVMQEAWRRTNSFDAVFSSAHVVGRMISLKYHMHWYNAGAVHPVHSPKFFNYMLEPVVYLRSFRYLFQNDEALTVIQNYVQLELVRSLYDQSPDFVDISWIQRGTANWSDYASFNFDKDGFSFQFPSYHVACYAAGMPTAAIPYKALTPYLTDSILYALDLHRPV